MFKLCRIGLLRWQYTCLNWNYIWLIWLHSPRQSFCLSFYQAHMPLWNLVTTVSACILTLNSSHHGQNGRHFPGDILKCIFMNEKFYILIQILLKFVPKGVIKNIPALAQIMAWRRSGDKPLSEPMLTQFTDAYMHICGTRGRWVNSVSQNCRHSADFCLSILYGYRWFHWRHFHQGAFLLTWINFIPRMYK